MEWLLDLAPLISIVISLMSLAVTTTALLIIPYRADRGRHSTGRHRGKSRTIARRERKQRRKAIRRKRD